METKTCKNCGADYHFNWGDNECYGCAKKQHVASVLTDQQFHGVAVEMANDAYANAYPTEGAEVNFQGYVLKENWEYHPKECIKCLCGHKHTVMEHAENVHRYAKAQKEIKAMKCNILLKPLWTPETQHCSLCFTYTPHSAGEHVEKIKYEMDTYSGHKEPNSINFPETNKPVVSEIRPMTFSERVMCEKRKLESNIRSEMDAIIVGSDNNSGPAKDSAHVGMVYAIDELAQMKEEEKEARWMSMSEWTKTIKKHPEYKQQYWSSVLSKQDQEDLSSWYRQSFSSY